MPHFRFGNICATTVTEVCEKTESTDHGKQPEREHGLQNACRANVAHSGVEADLRVKIMGLGDGSLDPRCLMNGSSKRSIETGAYGFPYLVDIACHRNTRDRNRPSIDGLICLADVLRIEPRQAIFFLTSNFFELTTLKRILRQVD